MSRPKIAFVGSGGAIKGIAHLGVLKAFEELRLRPDVFVGTSAGAIASAFFSQGVSVEEMVDWFRPFTRRRAGGLRGRAFFGLPSLAELRSPGWLTSGLLSIDRFERHLGKLLPMNDFRQLARPVYVTATDVDGRGRAVFGPGHIDDVPISQAVAASCCVPLLFRPYKIGGRYYLDGELVRTLSIDLAVAAGADVVVISNVYRPHLTNTRSGGRDLSQPGDKSVAHSGPAAVMRQSLNTILSEKEARGIELIHKTHPHVTVLNVSADLGHFAFTSRRDSRKLLLRGYREALRVLVAARRRGVLDEVTPGAAAGA